MIVIVLIILKIKLVDYYVKTILLIISHLFTLFYDNFYVCSNAYHISFDITLFLIHSLYELLSYKTATSIS